MARESIQDIEERNGKLYTDVSEYLIGQGYKLGDVFGIPHTRKERNRGTNFETSLDSLAIDKLAIGIIKPQPSDSFGHGRLVFNNRDLYIGTLIPSREHGGFIENSTWTLAIYGNNYVGELTGVSNSLSQKFDLKIRSRLFKSNPLKVANSDEYAARNLVLILLGS